MGLALRVVVLSFIFFYNRPPPSFQSYLFHVFQYIIENNNNYNSQYWQRDDYVLGTRLISFYGILPKYSIDRITQCSTVSSKVKFLGLASQLHHLMWLSVWSSHPLDSQWQFPPLQNRNNESTSSTEWLQRWAELIHRRYSSHCCCTREEDEAQRGSVTCSRLQF